MINYLRSGLVFVWDFFLSQRNKNFEFKYLSILYHICQSNTINHTSIDTLKKFITQKNKMSEFLTEFHEEVSESHKSIWKELNTLKTKFTFGRQSSKECINARME